MVGLVAFMVDGARCREVCSPLRQGTGLGVRVLDVSVGICVCGRVCLGGHNPGKGREGWVDANGQMGAALAAMAAVVRLGHVKKVGCEERGNEGGFLKEKGSIAKKKGVKRAFCWTTE
jgi:hypothetical protein